MQKKNRRFFGKVVLSCWQHVMPCFPSVLLKLNLEPKPFFITRIPAQIPGLSRVTLSRHRTEGRAVSLSQHQGEAAAAAVQARHIPVLLIITLS